MQAVRSGPVETAPRDAVPADAASLPPPAVAWPRVGGHGRPDGRDFCSVEVLQRVALSPVELPGPLGHGVETSAADFREDPGLFIPALVLAVLPGTGIDVACVAAVDCGVVDRGGKSDVTFSSETFTEKFLNTTNSRLGVAVV